MTYYLTKYALSGGVRLVEKEDIKLSAAEFVYIRGLMSGYKLGRDIFVSREEAVSAVEKMRLKRITSISKQLAAMHKVNAEELVRAATA